MDTTRTVTPLAAALLAAEKIAKPGKLDGVHIAGSQAKVSQSDLAAKLLAFAFMHLRDEGALTLQIASKKVLFVTTTWVQVQRTGSPAATDGVAAALFNATRDGKSVRDAVWDWFGQSYSNPYPIPVQAATQEAIEAGYLLPAKQGIGGVIGSMFTGAVATTVAPGKEDDVRAIADETAAKWAEYQTNGSALLDMVVKQCTSGIHGRLEASTPNV
jgi:hypothetical protein